MTIIQHKMLDNLKTCKIQKLEFLFMEANGC